MGRPGPAVTDLADVVSRVATPDTAVLALVLLVGGSLIRVALQVVHVLRTEVVDRTLGAKSDDAEIERLRKVASYLLWSVATWRRRARDHGYDGPDDVGWPGGPPPMSTHQQETAL